MRELESIFAHHASREKIDEIIMKIAYTEHPDAEELFVLEVPGTPVAKGRPRVTRNGIAFTPKKTRDYEADIRQLARLKMGAKEPFSGPLWVSVSAKFLPPQSWPKWKRAKVTSHGVFISMTTKPDIDNLAKVIDALNGIVWQDDAQICHLEVHKSYGLEPRLTVSVRHRRMDIHSKTRTQP